MTADSQKDIEHLKAIGHICAEALRVMQASVRAGMTTRELDEIGRAFLEAEGARSAPQAMYKFPGGTCISVSPVIAHGIPMLMWVVCNISIAIALTMIFQLESIIQLPPPWTTVLTHILTIFVVAPFVLGFPKRGQTYGDYLSEIRLTRIQPLLGLILLGLSCF